MQKTWLYYQTHDAQLTTSQGTKAFRLSTRPMKRVYTQALCLELNYDKNVSKTNDATAAWDVVCILHVCVIVFVSCIYVMCVLAYIHLSSF